MELKGVNMNIGNKLTLVLTKITIEETKLDEIACTNRFVFVYHYKLVNSLKYKLVILAKNAF